MSRTIMELFHSSGLKESVKADKETFVEQETSGIRNNINNSSFFIVFNFSIVNIF